MLHKRNTLHSRSIHVELGKVEGLNNAKYLNVEAASSLAADPTA